MKSNFIEECKAIVVEGSFSSRWAEIEMYHELGKRIIEEQDFTLKNIKRLSYEIDKSEEEILKAILFYKRYPELNMMTSGKNISWRIICEEYL